jgi:hypothetical protein
MGKNKSLVLEPYKQYLKIKKVDFGLVVEVDFIDSMVNSFLMLLGIGLGNNRMACFT